MPKTDDAALATFVARKAEIEVELDCIRAACADPVFASPEDVRIASLRPSRVTLRWSSRSRTRSAPGWHANVGSHRCSIMPVTFGG
jgi:hypothetical protein